MDRYLADSRLDAEAQLRKRWAWVWLVVSCVFIVITSFLELVVLKLWPLWWFGAVFVTGYAIGLPLFRRLKRFDLVINILFSVFIVVALFAMIQVGGYTTSLGFIFIGMNCAMGSILAGNLRWTIGLCILYCVTILIVGIFHSSLTTPAFITPRANNLSFVGLAFWINACIFFIVNLFMIDKDRFEKSKAEKLKKTDEAKTRLFTNVSHEIRTPLTVIEGIAEQMELHPERWMKNGPAKIKVQSRILLRLVNQMLNIAKIEAKQMPVNFINGDIRQFVRYVADNKDVAGYLQTILTKQYRIEWAWNGTEGLEKARDMIPDNILSDVMMPEMDGFEMLEHLKNDIRTDHIPVVILTARADFNSKLTGLEKGADHYLVKPFNEKELRLKLNNLLELRRKMQNHFEGIPFHSPFENARYKAESEFLNRINALINKEIGNENFDISAICLSMNMSRAQLYRKFSAITNKSIGRYLRSYRLYNAKELLEKQGRNVTEAAFDFPEISEPEMFIVGIGYKIKDRGDWGAYRSQDLTPTNIPSADVFWSDVFSKGTGRPIEVKTGGAAKFIDFFARELFPFIESNYRVSPAGRGLGGYSYGGLFSLYVLFSQPELFNIYFAGSPSIKYDNGLLFTLEDQYSQSHEDLKVRLFMSAGGSEDTIMISNVKKMATQLESRNYPGLTINTNVFPDETYITSIPSSFMRAFWVLYKH